MFWILYVFFWVFPRRPIVVCRRFGTGKTAWFWVTPGSLFYTHWKKDGTTIQYRITRPHPDTRLLYLPSPHLLTHSEPPTTWCPPPPLVLPARANLGPGINTTSSSHYSYFILYIQPLKMELIEGSETSANHNRTPGKYPKEYIQRLMKFTLGLIHIVLIVKTLKLCGRNNTWNRYSIVSVVNRLRAGRSRVRVPSRWKINFTLRTSRPALGAHPSSQSMNTGDLFPGDETAVVWGWPLLPFGTSEWVEPFLYFHLTSSWPVWE